VGCGNEGNCIGAIKFELATTASHVTYADYDPQAQRELVFPCMCLFQSPSMQPT
jgi:hypothetical protein